MSAASERAGVLASRVRATFARSIEAKQRAADALAGPLVDGAQLLAGTLREGGKVLACGNGGSAADAQHFAAEMVNRFERERPAIAAVAISTDSSALTSIANDYHFDRVFARQVEALGRAGDVLLAITTSGQSANVLAAIEAAHARAMRVLLLTGRAGGAAGALREPGDVTLCVPERSTARIQEVHLLAIHCLCDLVDELLFPNEEGP